MITETSGLSGLARLTSFFEERSTSITVAWFTNHYVYKEGPFLLSCTIAHISAIGFSACNTSVLMYGFKSSQTENCVEFIAGVPWKFYHSCAFSDNLHFSNTSAIIFWLMSNASSVNRVLNSRIPISYYDRFKFPSTVLDVWTSNLRFNLRFFIPSGAFWTLYCFIEGTSADTLLLLLFKLSLLLLVNNPLPTFFNRGDDAFLVCVSKMSVQMAVSGRVSSICDNSLSEMRPFPLKSKSWKIILSSLSWPSKQYFSRIQKWWF